MAAKKAVAKSKPKSEAKPPRTDADEYLKRLRSLKGVKDDDFSMFGSDLPSITITEWISTGSIAIDKALGGGWPIGAISECRSWEHVGKSTLLDQSIAYAQSIGGIGVLIDAEHSREEKWTRRLGVDLDKLIVKKASYLEEAFAAIDQVLAIQKSIALELKGKKRKDYPKPPPMIIAWDALGSTPPKAEYDDPYCNIPGLLTRISKSNFRRLTHLLGELRVGLVCANHLYKGIGAFSSPNNSPGGGAVRFHTHVRVELARTGALTLGQSTDPVGHMVKVTSKKNRVIGVQAPIETALVRGAGFDNSYTLYEWGRVNGWVVVGQGWQYLNVPMDLRSEVESKVNKDGLVPFQKQFFGLGEVLSEHPKIYQAMVASFMASV